MGERQLPKHMADTRTSKQAGKDHRVRNPLARAPPETNRDSDDAEPFPYVSNHTTKMSRGPQHQRMVAGARCTRQWTAQQDLRQAWHTTKFLAARGVPLRVADRHSCSNSCCNSRLTPRAATPPVALHTRTEFARNTFVCRHSPKVRRSTPCSGKGLAWRRKKTMDRWRN